MIRHHSVAPSTISFGAPVGHLNIQHRRQITGFEFHLTDKVFGLFGCIPRRVKEVICPADYPCFLCVFPVLFKMFILPGDSFGSLDKCKVYPDSVHIHGRHLLPQDCSLMVRNINSVDVVSFGNRYPEVLQVVILASVGQRLPVTDD